MDIKIARSIRNNILDPALRDQKESMIGVILEYDRESQSVTVGISTPTDGDKTYKNVSAFQPSTGIIAPWISTGDFVRIGFYENDEGRPYIESVESKNTASTRKSSYGNKIPNGLYF